MTEYENSNGCCGVSEQEFPFLGKCMKTQAIAGVNYIKRCENCCVCTSISKDANLEVTHLFECFRYGYGKRIKNKPKARDYVLDVKARDFNIGIAK